MDTKQVEDILREALKLDEVYVSSDGSHFQVIAVSDQFDGMSRVKKQQLIYAPLADKIADGSVHALSIKTFSAQEWQREKKFNIPQ